MSINFKSQQDIEQEWKSSEDRAFCPFYFDAASKSLIFKKELIVSFEVLIDKLKLNVEKKEFTYKNAPSCYILEIFNEEGKKIIFFTHPCLLKILEKWISLYRNRSEGKSLVDRFGGGPMDCVQLDLKMGSFFLAPSFREEANIKYYQFELGLSLDIINKAKSKLEFYERSDFRISKYKYDFYLFDSFNSKIPFKNSDYYGLPFQVLLLHKQSLGYLFWCITNLDFRFYPKSYFMGSTSLYKISQLITDEKLKSELGVIIKLFEEIDLKNLTLEQYKDMMEERFEMFNDQSHPFSQQDQREVYRDMYLDAYEGDLSNNWNND